MTFYIIIDFKTLFIILNNIIDLYILRIKYFDLLDFLRTKVYTIRKTLK